MVEAGWRVRPCSAMVHRSGFNLVMQENLHCMRANLRGLPDDVMPRPAPDVTAAATGNRVWTKSPRPSSIA